MALHLLYLLKEMYNGGVIHFPHTAIVLGRRRHVQESVWRKDKSEAHRMRQQLDLS